jgi:CBS domain-containing protein
MTPFEKLKRVSPDDDLHNAMKIITEEGLNQLPVIEDGKVIGMLTRENLLSFISVQQSLGA